MPLKKGHKIGNRFSETNQPESNGRKPSRYKQILISLEDIGEPLSKEDYSRIITSLLTLTLDELKSLREKKDTPIAILVIADAILGDLENQQLSNVEKLLDRTFGKAIATTEITGKDGKDLIPPARTLTKEEAKELLNSLNNEC